MIKHRQVQRRGRRSQMTTSFTDPAISMDLLRAVLQPSINEEIQTVFNKYMKPTGVAGLLVPLSGLTPLHPIDVNFRLSSQNSFFQKAALNVRDNVGEEVDAEQLIQEACRSCLEQYLVDRVITALFGIMETSTVLPLWCGQEAKLLFSDGEKVVPRLTHELPGIKAVFLPVPIKYHLISLENHLYQVTPDLPTRWKPKSCEPIRREGPKWDPARLNESTTFVLGSRANKALGMGGTRGRIYIKHPHLFKYAADPQDKHWLAEQHHMRATGGKMAYLLIEEDIRDLAASDDYRGCLDLKLEELKSFVLPSWMVEKMRKYMETLRTENEHRAVEAPPQT
ncbi:Deoxynucleotidyltransferase terminal-interacting protein 1 [Saguinus oedipus]|uniref:Deoxynucleotidyltransferase terminal-interacting protein 1 n=1 Tax=Saguinus oedipus TaxID=9490 RepID=A0ABQ9VL07_SAGOE|nr:Deoxynucleotidyltransferase terminal-interacting protein 1 [Saguinus oedipus]